MEKAYKIAQMNILAQKLAQKVSILRYILIPKLHKKQVAEY